MADKGGRINFMFLAPPPSAWPLDPLLTTTLLPVADLRGHEGRAPRLGVQILSISCSFWEILAKLYVAPTPWSWRPLLGEILDPPMTTNI